MTSIKTELPEQLRKKAMALVEQGWFRSEEEIYLEAIRRFLDSRQPELMEKFVLEDVNWGLHGRD